MDAKKLSMLIFIKKSFIQYVPASLQQLLRLLFIGPLKRLVRFVKEEIWLPIYRIEQGGLTVILIGHQACDPYLIELLYAEYLKPIRIGTVPIWSLSRAMHYWEDKADMVIFRDEKFRPRGTMARRMLNMPYLVAQWIDIPPSDADLAASTARSDLKKIKDAEFYYEMTQDPAKLDFYYHQMYLPYIQDRHGDAADIMPWETFRPYYEAMELLLILKAGLPVAGNLILQTGDYYTSQVLAVLNGDRELLKAGALAACYWFSMVEAHRRGCSTFNMQCARPFLKDGVLAYKKKWGSRIVMDHSRPELWLLPCGNRLPLHRFLENNPFICEQDGQLVSLIFLGPHTVLSDKELSTHLRECHYRGDRLSTCIVLLNSEWAARVETIQNIQYKLSPTSYILDLSHGSLTELPALLSNWQRLSGFATEFPELAYS